MAIYQLGDHVPVIPASCYIAPEATIIGSVTLGERVTVMAGAVVRGDNEPIVIGDDTNIQENCVLHTDLGSPLTLGKGVTVGHQVMLHGCTIGDGTLIGDDTNIQENCVLHTDPGLPLTLGKGVTVGHQVMLHGCTIGDGTLIGIQAVVLNNSVIGKDCLVGAGAVIIENKSFADRSVIFGSPAKAVREVSEDNVTRMRMSAEDYVKRGVQYKKELKRIG